MDNSFQRVFSEIGAVIIGYLPNLAAGLVLLLVGVVLGWLAKRVVVQVLVALRFDRPLQRFRWGAGLGKADVRHAFYESLGTLAMMIVLLVFLDTSLEALKIQALSEMLRRVVLFIPRLIIAMLIVGVGALASGWVSGSVQKALIKEEVPSATLIARFARSIVFLFFSAMALTELDVAREIVIIGFSAAIVTLGAISIVLTILGGRSLVEKLVRKSGE